MDAIVEKLIPLLKSEGIEYVHRGGRIRVPLPNNFGEVEIGNLDGNDTIVGLVGHEWHSHGDVLRYYGGESDEDSIFIFLKQIFSGKQLLVEERNDGKTTRKYICDDRNSVFKYLNADEEAIIHNEI